MKIRGTFGIEDIDWQNLEATAKKLGYTSRNELIQALVKKILYGDEVKTESTIKEQLEDEKLKKIQFENKELAEIKKRKLEAETKIAEYHAKNLDTIGSNPSRQAKQAMKHHVENTTPFDEDALHCPEENCKWSTSSKDSLTFQINRLRDHVQIYHKRNLTREENMELEDLLV